jgi:tetrahydromethanopterin S-methyltransferase subunit C
MKRILWAVIGAALVTAGCADPTAPTTPTPALPTIAETFSDTLLVLGANTHSFSVNAIGAVRVTLSSVEPGASVGLGIGTPSLGSCSVIDRVDAAVAGKAVLLSGTATVPGLYCVTIFDLGNLVEPAVYTINVLHS